MIHEYIEDKSMLGSALNAGHEFVAQLLDAERRVSTELHRRAWSAG